MKKRSISLAATDFIKRLSAFVARLLCLIRFRKISFSLLLSLTSCTNLFFFPSKDQAVEPAKLGLKYDEIEATQRTGEKIRGWKLYSEGSPKGTIFFFHGNAQNISYHIQSVYWLPKAGYNVIMMDYQGYGPSDGSPSVKGAISDILLTLNAYKSEQRPLIVYGQSIGASLLVPALSELGESPKIDGVVLESPFASYQQIAREKLGSLFLTWPLQYPLSLLISDRFAPDRFISQLPDAPLLVVCTKEDEIVPLHHSLTLFRRADEPKEIWEFDKGPHIGIFRNETSRARLVEYLDKLR